jgi:gamma-glutamyl:cysteine ligase YbdK (ATP-grasp superfamily)
LEYAGLADLMILHVEENDLKAERKSAKGALIAAHSVEEKKMTDDVMPMVTL